MHAREVEILRISAGLVAGDLAETGEPEPPRPARFVFEPNAPAQDRALGIRRDLHARFDPVQRMHDRETGEAGFLDAVVTRAPRRLEADRPGRLAVLAHIEEMPPRL